MRLAIVLFLLLQDADPARKLEDRQKELAAQLKQAKTPEGLNFVAEQYLGLAADAEAADAYDIAQKAVEQASRVAKGLKNAELTQRTQFRAGEIKNRQAEYGKAKGAFKTLEDKPDDAAANLTAGKYLCFIKGDWKKGLPCLAKGSDEGLRKLASKEELLAGAKLPAEIRLEAADDWWPKNRDRALHWYTQAWPDLNPLQKERVRGRLYEAQSRGKPLEKVTTPAGWMSAQGATDKAVVDEQFAARGRRSLRLTAEKSYWTLVHPGGASLAGVKECTFSIWFMVGGGRTRLGCAYIQLMSADDKILFKELVEMPADEPWWHEIRRTIKVPDGATKGIVYFVLPPEGVQLWLDDVSLKTEAGVELVLNGGFEN